MGRKAAFFPVLLLGACYVFHNPVDPDSAVYQGVYVNREKPEEAR